MPCSYNAVMDKSTFGMRLGVVLRFIIATVFIILGIIITPLPIPLGLVFIAIGIMVLAYDNKRLTRHIRILRRKFPAFSKKLSNVEKMKLGFIAELLKSTNPANPAKKH